MAQKVAVSGYYGFKNFGDELILSILTEKLHEAGADVTVFSVDPEFTAKTYGVSSVKTFDPRAVVRTLLECDTLISGGGSLFQDATSLKSVFYYAFVLGLAQLLGKKTVVFAQGVGPLYSPISRFLVKFLFKRASSVSVRDEKSLELMQKWGVDAKLVLDPAFSLTVTPQKKENALGVQLRSFEGLEEEFLQNLACAVAKNACAKVKLFSLQKSLDLEVCEKFAAVVKELDPQKEVEVVQDNLIEELSGVETLLSMRFHSLVVALKAGVKCAVINYDPKVQTLSEKYSLPLVELTDSTQTIQEKIKNARTAEVQAFTLHLDI